ncbi:MAG: FAD-dependent oxidoreductase [Actinomycetota bacterium]|nr:FAD-dependent oxidoreductase [Actinomycetota bacterium]MDD5666508.1 FAD-dependent oxidoreductase [Actinomycetota bacterium]
MDCDVIVIGGGYAGLSAGALLAHRGYEVLLLEKSRSLGGRAGFMEKDGYIVEYGLHANRNASDGAAAAVFRRLGRELEFIAPGEPELWREGGFVPLPNNVGKIFRSSMLPLPAKISAARYLVKLVAGNPAKKYQLSLEDLTASCKSQETLEILRVISGIGIIAPEPANASAGELAAYLKKALRSKVKVGYPRGGTPSIIGGLREELEKNGQIMTGNKVTRLMLKKGLVNQVKTETSSYTAYAVVSAMPVQDLPDLFGGKDLPIKFAKRARELVPTAGISLDVGLKEPVTDKNGLLVTSEPLSMGQFTSNIDPGMAPAGRQLLSWYYPLPLPWVKNADKMGREEQRLRGVLGEMFPGIWDAVDWERTLRLSMVDGFLPRPGQTRADRPDFTIPSLDNFFICGDTTRAEGTGGDTAFNSAIHVSGLVDDYLEEITEEEEDED